jgi:hypothetical protein
LLSGCREVGVEELGQLAVQIVRFVDDAQPGWVACELVDAHSRTHTFIDKVPIFTVMMLDAASVYPQPGSVGCEIVARWKDASGGELLRISTAKPWWITSTEEVSEFVVLPSQVVDD